MKDMPPKRKTKEDEKHSNDDSSGDATTEGSEVYCVCRKELDEEAEWIACDNPQAVDRAGLHIISNSGTQGSNRQEVRCPIEWFHIECVGLTADTVPEGDWFCDQCKLTVQPGSVAPSSQPAASPAAPTAVFVCEICEEQFTNKDLCIKHKQQHYNMYQQSLKDQPTQQNKDQGTLLEGQPGTSQSHNQKVLSWEMKSTTSEERATDPMSPQGNDAEDDNQSSLSSASHQQQTSQEEDEYIDLNQEKIRFLSNFSDEEIIAEMAKRKEAFVCCCGTVFQDQSLYFLHKGCHNTNNPRKCSFCGFEANDWYDFTSHFYVHKKDKIVE